jgi:HAD superfamily hydrolase (TIGR01509 family)
MPAGGWSADANGPISAGMTFTHETADRIAIAPFQAVVFDMDGTILDTETVFKTIVFEVCDELGFAMTDAVHLGMVGSSHERSSELLLEAFGVSFPYALFNEKCGVVMRERMHQVVPVKLGAREILAELHARGIPTAIATSSRRNHVELHLGNAGLMEMFDAIVTRDDVVNPKPDPEPYLTAAARLGIDPAACLALEDSHAGVRAAHAAGMQTVMVPDLVHPSAEIRALGIAIMESLDHVRQAFPVHRPRG